MVLDYTLRHVRNCNLTSEQLLTPRHAELLGDLLKDAGTAGNLVMDAHLAALAIEHGARLCTLDRDFARFPGLQSFAPA